MLLNWLQILKAFLLFPFLFSFNVSSELSIVNTFTIAYKVAIHENFMKKSMRVDIVVVDDDDPTATEFASEIVTNILQMENVKPLTITYARFQS